MASRLVDDLYAKLVNEEDARVCREIPDAACREVPRNFFLLIASGLASSVSAPFWGQLADWSSRTVMAVAALIAGVLGVIAVAVEWMIPGLAGQVWFYPLVFFVLMVAHSGVRLGRKTYVVDLADGNRRTDYVAVSNSVIGVVLLLLGGMGTLAQLLSVPLVILVLSALGLAGAAMSRNLPDVT